GKVTSQRVRTRACAGAKGRVCARCTRMRNRLPATLARGPVIHDDVLRAIGRTPLVRLRRVVPAGCGEVLAKLEYFAPGGRVKDRTALAMVLDAEARGLLKPR